MAYVYTLSFLFIMSSVFYVIIILVRPLGTLCARCLGLAILFYSHDLYNSLGFRRRRLASASCTRMTRLDQPYASRCRPGAFAFVSVFIF